MNSHEVKQLVQVLGQTISGDQNDLETAQQFLEYAASENPAEIMRCLDIND